ncbi:MAG: flagellar biosynthesis protein FliQ [Acidimicrobiales bacterium]
MNDADVIEIAVRMLTVTGELAAPMLVTALAVGLAISLIQSVTSIQEVTLTFVPKMAGVALAIVLSGHWMLDTLVGFTNQLFEMIPQLVGS